MEHNEIKFSDDVKRLNPGIATAPREKTSPPSKYKNVRTIYKGMLFQSGKEAAGVAKLILLEEQHLIFGLRLQVRFPLAKDVAYIADAVYSEVRNGTLQVVVVDFKGYETQSWKIKRKLFKERYGIDITIT